jgi:hypothetical protein
MPVTELGITTVHLRIPSRGRFYTSRHPFDEERVGAAAVYCSDGRFGEQMDEFLHEGLGLPRYDRVAIPGGAACLAGHGRAAFERAALERQLRFLIESHALTRVVFIAHQDCLFYRGIPLGKRTIAEQQSIDLVKAAECVKLWCPHVEIDSYLARRVEGRVTFEPWPSTV